MKRIQIPYQPGLFFLILYTCISFGVYFYILFYRVPSDLNAHIQILLKFLEVGSIPTPPLYYLMVYLLHFIMPYKEGFGMAALFVLTAAGSLKFWWSFYYLKTFCPTINHKIIGLFSLALMFFAPVTLFIYEGELWYLAKFTSFIWHNSTTLLSFPFCVLLFHYTVVFLRDRDKKGFFKVLLVSVIIILIKPSFIFAYMAAFPLIILLMDKNWSSSFFWSAGLVVLLLILIFLEKVFIYNINPIDDHLEKGLVSGIGIRPFFLWCHYSETPIWDIVSSFLFPFFFISINFRILISDVHFVFSGILIAFALIIYFLLIETGPRMMDGNFFWQVILTLFIGYLVLCKHLIICCSNQKNKRFSMLSFKDKLMVGLFSIHVIGGIAYTVRIIMTHNIS